MKSSNKNIKNGKNGDKSRAVGEAFDAIKNMLYYKELAPGQRLVYGDLAKKLNMSLTPVIQALNKLEYSELVFYEPHKGYFVGQITEKEVKEIYQAREALEVSIIPSIIQNINKKDLTLIRKFIVDYEKSLTNMETRQLNLLKDMQFHIKLAEFSRQDVIQKVLRNLLERICLKYRPEYLGDERIVNAIKEHRRILKAFEMKDVEEAISAVKHHNRAGAEYIIGSLERSKTSFF
ncbi:MAG: GntR family transcriptional regulator [Desulfobacterales bacterium]|jgi:DNA-binding GntR family transcriptional regulator|nr:GntR family transcriptional regulator [Desulfobacteraceae bacterium]MBT7086636.1 GntR family transcriptional regulator [Desulfobacterales bacterium]MBT7696852.1 GntR family transcriptional regulator [Desulfobacterales bacterium]